MILPFPVFVETRDIEAIGYDPETKVLEVEFHSGAVTRYRDVPPEVYAAFTAASSQGSHYAQFIRGRYPSQVSKSDATKDG
jgi:hypothetical protein